MNIINYSSDQEELWDDFVENHSINGTFLQTRRFLGYHRDRFADASLLIYSGNKLIAVCPACRVSDGGKTLFYSHRGSTYGGLVFAPRYYKFKYVSEALSCLTDYLHQNRFNSVYLKFTPDILSHENNALIEYCMLSLGYEEFKEINTYVDFSTYKEDILSNFRQGKRTHVNTLLKMGAVLRPLDSNEQIAQFHAILSENLRKYDAKPVHSVDELLEFKTSRLKDEVAFWGVYLDGEMIAGSMLFYFNATKVAHTQYMAAASHLKGLSPMTYLYYCIIEQARAKGFEKLSWGIATEDLGRTLNKGLLESKESYGSLYSINRTYHKVFI